MKNKNIEKKSGYGTEAVPFPPFCLLHQLTISPHNIKSSLFLIDFVSPIPDFEFSLHNPNNFSTPTPRSSFSSTILMNFPIISALVAFAIAQSIKFFTTWYCSSTFHYNRATRIRSISCFSPITYELSYGLCLSRWGLILQTLYDEKNCSEIILGFFKFV